MTIFCARDCIRPKSSPALSKAKQATLSATIANVFNGNNFTSVPPAKRVVMTGIFKSSTLRGAKQRSKTPVESSTRFALTTRANVVATLLYKFRGRIVNVVTKSIRIFPCYAITDMSFAAFNRLFATDIASRVR